MRRVICPCYPAGCSTYTVVDNVTTIRRNRTVSDRPGCLSGLLKLFLLQWLFDWLQDNFGRGRGGVCGCGCGLILTLIFIALACSIFLNTDWLSFGF